MRLDYGLYALAVICFLISGFALVGYALRQYLVDVATTQIVMLIFIILGLIFAGGGYSQRPKKIPMPIVLPKREVPEEKPAPPPVEEQPPPPPTALPAPEPEKPKEEKPRRRRRKKT